jgi:iron complex transport system ATP-binding protein
MRVFPMHPILTANELSVLRGGRTLLDRVSLRLTPGRVTAVVGPNGAGKSTLLKALAGEFSPDSGEIAFEGRPLAGWRPQAIARRRAVVPQESDLRFPFLVEQVVRLGRIPHADGGEGPLAQRFAREALAVVDLLALSVRHYPTLSGGEKQRVHLARALAQLRAGPGEAAPAGRVLLLDEPTASLDLAHQHSVLALARRLAVNEAVAVLAVLHDLNLVLTYADDVVVLRGGRVVADGTVESTLTPELVSEVFGVPARLVPPEQASPGTRAQLLLGPCAA